MADVKITIDIDADTAAIQRVRAQLRALCREVDDCTETHEKHAKALRDLADAQDKVHRNRGRDEDGFKKSGSAAKKLTGMIKSLAKFGFKYMAIEGAGALAVIGSAGILFKAGSFLAKGYQAALSGVSYGFAAAAAAASAFLAAQRQFQEVQFGPQYSGGAINTESQYTAASQAMKMFVDDTQLAVIGTKGLSSAFKTLSDQAPVTGKTTAVFRELTNYTTGIGGDLEKSSQALAAFIAQFQKDKGMTAAVKEAGKKLGPDFEKILKEANKLGVKTYADFAKAAISGELGDTFKKYAGQLDVVNNTVIGRFKSGWTELKGLLIEVGEPLLEPLTRALPRAFNIVESLIIRIRANTEAIGRGSLLNGLVSGLEKVSILIGRLVTRDIGQAGVVIEKMKSGWNLVTGFFEKVQDYLRQLVPASVVLGEIFIRLLTTLGGGFADTINNLSENLIKNKSAFMEFTDGFARFMRGFGELKTSVTNIVVQALPAIGLILDIFGKIFSGIAKILDALTSFGHMIGSIIDKATFGFDGLSSAIKKTIGAVLVLSATIALMMGKIGKGGFLSNFTSNVGKLKNIRTTAGGVIDKLPRGGRLDALRLRGMYGMEKVGGSLARIGGGSTTAGAATVAGTAVAGYLAGGLVSDKLFNANTKLSRAGGAAAGAGTGAAVGATIGSVIPGLGTAAGAIIGGIAGAIGGWVKAGKERRKFDNIAKNTLEEYGKSMDKAIESGDIESLKKAAKKANEDYYALLAEGKYGTQAFKARKDELDALNKQTKTTQKNFSNFETFFGDPDKLIEALGPDAVEKAKNGIIDIFQVMRDGGVDVQATWRAVMGDFNQQLLDQRLAMFDNAIQAIETSEAVNAAQQKILEGDTSEKSVIDFLKKSYEYALDKTGGDAVAATALLDKSLSKAYGRGGALEKVADVVKLQADKLKLFDPQVLLDQVMQTGKLEAQGRAIESMTGGQVNAGEATLRLMQLYATGGATSGKQIDQLMLGALSNKITKAQLMSGLFGEGQLGTFSKLANKPAGMSGERSAAEDEFIRNRNRATGGMVAPDTQGVNVGGVTINVSGFIKDPSVAKMIAEEVQKATAQYIARAGAGSTAPPAKRE